ncbi:probable serine/threonine-protein kinase kinX [Ceratitis capitata]|uniref:probable serine/threonine-protein kinase kinX n=1 Tax=Ceratitis capitata TaxID=7213 RepID=UPI00032A194F|nr:probable serine/threonine-protein kinase kinX [Ceratitis capitata]
MNFKHTLLALTALLLAVSAMAADTKMEDKMEDTTESPVVDFAVIEPAPKTSTERPPTAATTAQKASPSVKSGQPQVAQPHTVADFIIHPLIAFKPRAPEEDIAGKQAGDSSSTTPSPWTLFGFNAGQGLGSSVSNSVSNLAGSVSGWLTDRIQLPGLVDSPVRESTTTSTTTTTTTTQRPDVVVRVQHKASTRRPLISITNENRPQRFHNNNLNFVSDEEDDDDDVDEEFEEEEPNVEEENVDEEEEEATRPVRRPQQKRPQQQRRRRPVIVDDFSDEEEYDDDSQESNDEDEPEDDDTVDDEDDLEEDNVQLPNIRRQQNNINRRRQQPQRRRLYAGQNFAVRRVQKPNKSDEVEDDDEDFYYRPSTKRSQNEANFFQRGQENIINQLRQLTGGRTPAQIGNLVRKSTKQSANTKPKQRQQTTLFVNRNGQTVYLAPELLNADLPFVNPQVHYLKPDGAQAPSKRKNAPTQYITIPWSQLGISPPDQLHAITEGVQTQPLILNIPASAIKTLQSQNGKRKKQPVITAEAVPLLAEASIMDVFKPPKIPHDRHTSEEATPKPSNTGMPVIIASKTKPSNGNTVTILPQRIRPGTIVEKAPTSADSPQEASEEMTAPESVRNVESEYILVGEDNEQGLTRQVKPVYGEGRYVYGGKSSPYLELLQHHGGYAVRRTGRELEIPAQETSNNEQSTKGEQLIPVQIINELSEETKLHSDEKKEAVVTQEKPQSEPESTQSEAQVEAQELQQQTLGGALPLDVPLEENKANEPVMIA